MARAERPLDPGDGPLLRWAADLRKLREKAGSPGYRELARRAHYSAGALSEAASGRKLPSLAVTVAYVQACGGDIAAWERRWRDLSAELAELVETAPQERKAPYVGLSAFQTQDADRFFGRRELVEQVRARVFDTRFVAVVGASGAGKTSLLRAGLLPTITTHAVVVMTPGARPIEECAIALASLTATSPTRLVEDLAVESRALHRFVRHALAGHPAEADLVLVVDQFEEIFTQCPDRGERARFIDLLATATTADNSRLRVVVGVRADFYSHCSRYPHMVDVLQQAQVLVGPMTTPDLREVITRPAIGAGCSVESTLQATLCAEADGRIGVLPLLSHALLETWRRRRGNALTLAGYHETGGITGAVARTAETAYTALTEPQQQWARQLFLRLVALGEGTEDARRRLDRAELDLAHPDADVVLENLAQARLVTLDHDGIEIVHEALIRHWPRLTEWLNHDREGLRVHRQLTDATTVWEGLDRDPGALYRGTRLALARDWSDTAQTHLTPREQAFLEASLAAEAGERVAAQRRTRRLRQLVALLAVLFLLATTATVYAVHTQAAITEQRNAAIAQNVAVDATELFRTKQDLAVQLSVTAHRLAATTETRNSLISTLSTTLINQPHEIYSVDFSRDGRVLATASGDHTVRLWDVTGARVPTELATVPNTTGTVFGVAFSPDGHTLATANQDNNVRLWDITNPRQLTELAAVPNAPNTVYGVGFSPDGHILVTSDFVGHVRLWDITNRQRPTEMATLTGHSSVVYSVTFTPDGHTLATAGEDSTARIWDITNPRNPSELVALNAHTRSAVYGVDFSPDGRTLATAGNDNTARLWDVTTPRTPTELATLNGHTSGLFGVDFSPDGRTLATSGGTTARLWDVTNLRSPTERTVLTGHITGVWSVAFRPDGRALATSGWDRTARVTPTDTDELIARACDHVHSRITPAEWDQYLPGIPYDPPCPSR
ncbi:hypothetical protein ALI144C_19170 [Actinosynnema sp. ALI-1.44]|uniref:nSTAND1 domain-containing NTPase n=1 Tax=Actinosynnema sp. ALI-1.44 TaxID=1933779 RepID=UPI00097BD25C|nr:hypothetical protein [Actinosynnema sp. ALI-1.44]ONI81455.1 hypothetical protein ALI144C_19170 [Actinosynnema sp. ALI-1.44]